MEPAPYAIDPEPSNTKRYALLLLGLFFLILLFQWRFGYEPEKARLEAERVEALRVLSKVQNLEPQPDLAEEREELRRRVPEKLEVEPFLTAFQAWVESGGARVDDVQYEVREHDLYEEARLIVRLHGGQETIEALLQRRGQLERLIEWGDVDEGSGELRFSLFAMRAPPSVVHRLPCEESERHVPTWPFTAWLEERRVELRRICAELAARPGAVDRVESYESLAGEIEMLRRFIDAKQGS